jgi:hypothetical protein
MGGGGGMQAEECGGGAGGWRRHAAALPVGATSHRIPRPLTVRIPPIKPSRPQENKKVQEISGNITKKISAAL